MPNIQILTNLPVPAEKADEIKTLMGKAIETFPGKTERWLMVEIRDKATLYFQGSGAPCLLASVELLGSATDEVYERMTALLTKTLSETLSLPPDRIYTRYSEYTHWGWNGSNF